jgi:CRP-like cAMP-binding protein
MNLMDHKENALSGKLTFINLPDLLQLLGTNGSTGVLKLVPSAISTEGYVYFVKGNPVDASVNHLSGLDALYSFFGWQDAYFEFSEQPVKKENVIQKSRMGIILDGLRMLDDGEIKTIGADTLPDTPEKPEESIPFIKGPFIDYLYVVDEEYFSDREIIIDEGKYGRWMWVILEGMVEISKQTPHGTIPLIRLGEGCFIGNISFLLNNNIRSASIVAVGDVQLGVMDSQILLNEWMSRSFSFRQLIASYVRRLKHMTNTAVNFYEKQDRLTHVLANMKAVIRKGHSLRGLACITEGEAAIVKPLQDQPVVLITLSKGDYIGYVPFLDPGHEPYSASVYGTQDFKVKPVDIAEMKKEFEQLSSTFRNMIENLMVCIGVTTKTACDFYKKMD